MLQGALTDGAVRISEGSVLVFLILKKIGIDGARRNSVAAGEILDFICAFYAFRTIPQHVQNYCRGESCEEVHLTGIAELFLGRRGGRRLNEFSETSPCIGEAPGGKFDAKCLKRGKNPV